jgi:outer membrane receptor protein involved in Fe transport
VGRAGPGLHQQCRGHESGRLHRQRRAYLPELGRRTPPLKATVGFFIDRQLQNVWKQYVMPGYGWTSVHGGTDGQPSPNPAGLAQSISVPNFDNTLWLTDEQRVDRDQAAFAQIQWDITSQWSLQGGIRFYRYDNSLGGFYGYSAGYSSHTGVSQCFPGVAPINSFAPCTNLDTEVSKSGSIPKATLTFKPTCRPERRAGEPNCSSASPT